MRSQRVLFLSATERELAPLRRLLGRERPSFSAKLAVTGVGKAAAACQAALELAARSPDLVVQVGCAGAFRGAGLAVGDVIVSSLEVLADDGALTPAGFLDLEELRLPVTHVGRRPIFNELPVYALRRSTWKRIESIADGRFAIHRGRTATVSTMSGTNRRARELRSRWRVLAESMEGAAAAFAAIASGLRLIEVRGISNLAGDRDRAAWDIDGACRHAAAVARRVVELELARR